MDSGSASCSVGMIGWYLPYENHCSSSGGCLHTSRIMSHSVGLTGMSVSLVQLENIDSGDSKDLIKHDNTKQNMSSEDCYMSMKPW